MPRSARTVLSRHNFHRTYHAALAKLTDPTGELRPTAGRALKALRAGGPQTIKELTVAVAKQGLMGHEATGRSRQHQGSAMGAHYRHTTSEMAGRVIDAIDRRLTVVLRVAEQALEQYPNRLTPRAF